MGRNELVKASTVSVPAASGKAILPELVERAGAATHFVWEEFFYTEHHNPHTPGATGCTQPVCSAILAARVGYNPWHPASGELQSAAARILPANLGGGSATNRASRAFARRLGNATDDAGHAIGNNLGGSGGARSGNIFPQNLTINRGAYNQFEQEIAEAVANGSTAFVRVIPHYHTGSTRPFEILYQARIDGQTISQVFPNP
jgi:hypothetical protein